MFKVGDKVRFVAFQDDSKWEKEYGMHIGDICEVKNYYSDKSLWIVSSTNDNVCVEMRQIDLVKEESKVKPKFHVLDNSIVLSYNGKMVVVANEDERYATVLSCIREKRLEDIPAAVEIERKYNGDGIELKDGLLVAQGEVLPSELENRILKFKELKLPYDALLKFWDNLKKNPSFNARKMLFKFLEHNGHPLTEDGYFIAYRGVTEDFKDAHTKSFDNKPGSVCEMPRELVDDNPNHTCSSGLHVACFEYAKGFATKLVEVKVNPADVVCVPVDYNGTKMRTCRFEVVQECSGLLEGELRTFETGEDEEFGCNACGDEECFNLECESEEVCSEEVCNECKEELDYCLCHAAPEVPKSKKREVNGTGKSRQLRHAVRGPKGTFVKG